MQEGRTAHLPYLSVTEKPGQRRTGNAIQEDVAVMVGPPEEVLASAEAGEEQGPPDVPEESLSST